MSLERRRTTHQAQYISIRFNKTLFSTLYFSSFVIWLSRALLVRLSISLDGSAVWCYMPFYALSQPQLSCHSQAARVRRIIARHTVWCLFIRMSLPLHLHVFFSSLSFFSFSAVFFPSFGERNTTNLSFYSFICRRRTFLWVNVHAFHASLGLFWFLLVFIFLENFVFFFHFQLRHREHIWNRQSDTNETNERFSFVIDVLAFYMDRWKCVRRCSFAFSPLYECERICAYKWTRTRQYFCPQWKKALPDFYPIQAHAHSHEHVTGTYRAHGHSLSHNHWFSSGKIKCEGEMRAHNIIRIHLRVWRHYSISSHIA